MPTWQRPTRTGDLGFQHPSLARSCAVGDTGVNWRAGHVPVECTFKQQGDDFTANADRCAAPVDKTVDNLRVAGTGENGRERGARRERNAVSLSEGPEGSRREAPTPSRQNWRRRPDLNRGWRCCRALPYHFATAPIGCRCCGTTNTASYQTPSGQSRIRRAALPVASWTPPDRGMIEVPPSGNNSVVECDLAKVEVAGSNPVSRSIFLYARGRYNQRFTRAVLLL